MLSRSLIFVISTLLGVSSAPECITDLECIVRPGEKSFAEQVIEVALNKSNSSFTILAYPGDYNAIKANTSIMNFVNFENVLIKRYTDDGVVNIMCREVTDTIFNGIGFEHSTNITLSGMSFSRCGIVTSGLFFFRTNNVHISDCSFHHNTDNGIQILSGSNFTIVNCCFYLNIGLQPDNTSDLIIDRFSYTFTRGVGLGVFVEDQCNVKIAITNCTFSSNIAYKTTDYDPSSDSRPYGFIPFGNGGAIYLRMNNVKNSNVSVSNCRFHNNTAIHQGGAIVMLPVNSTNNTLDISGCEFIGNKALGGPLRSRNETVNGTDVDDFVNDINTNFSMTDFITKSLNGTTITDLPLSGGFGGAIAMGVYGTSMRNKLLVKDSHFSSNIAVFACGAVGLIVRDSLSDVQDGVDSNQATIDNCTFVGNRAFLTGSAIGVASYARVDTASLPINIVNCTFEYNDNNVRWIQNASPTFAVTGTVVGIRFPVVFSGTNIFRSNTGGGINMNHARITINGTMLFQENYGATIGGAMRIGEVTLLHVMPDAHLTFINNSASQLGGAIGVENVRGSDVTVILSNFCFIQYNIGGENEYDPKHWMANFTFSDNMVSHRDGQGDAFFADNVVRCVLSQEALMNNNRNIFSESVFSNPFIFNFHDVQNSSDRSHFETEPHELVVQNNNITASPGEIFDLLLFAKDENNNIKNAVYSYQSNPTASPSSIIEVDLDSNGEEFSSFASVSRTNVTLQRTLIVTRDRQLQRCDVNFRNSNKFLSSFTLNLIDSSRGQMVNTATVNVNVQCCHVGYEYNNDTGQCLFTYSEQNDVILRQDSVKHTYIYIQSTRYGGFDSDGYFVTARIPPSYQNCTQEGRLSGCLVMDDDLDQQCNQGRTGFLCGKCPKDTTRGTALNLIECRTCGISDIVVFVIICLLIVTVSVLIIYLNVRLTNALKGFLFFIQFVGYVYNTGTNNGELQWHFYLSRFFGFSLFLPLCISSNLDAVEVAVIGFVTPVLIILTVSTYIFLARYFPHLSKRKTVDGIWFLILIAYVYTADTCLNLLRCVQVYEPTEFKGKLVYYYDGTLQCLAGQHLPYGVIALTVLVLVLIPFPIYVFAIIFNLVKKAGPLKDVISSGVDNKCYWWSGYDLLRRLLFFTVYVLVEDFYSDYTQCFMLWTNVLKVR
ncbi:uncharacterized protein [Dysidea avara]|uniref:uncharacterized protein isoform X4 n=1 Tax=Dysidea avara TaxID=196820 RepID=UPI00332787BE